VDAPCQLEAAERVAHITCVADDRSGATRGAVALDIVIERWSKQGVQDTVAAAAQRGPSELLSALSAAKENAGLIEPPGRMGWDIKYAQETRKADGTRQILLLTSKSMNILAGAGGPLADTPFRAVQLLFRTNGSAEGRLATIEKVGWDPASTEIGITEYRRQPIQLVRIQLE